MFKKIGILICLLSCVVFIGCAGPYTQGILFSDYRAPACSPDDDSGLKLGLKTGTSQMINYVGFVATGDASIQEAAANGGIKTVKTVEYQYNSILGIINTTTTIVTGE